MAKSLALTICLLLVGAAAWAQAPAAETPAKNQSATAPAKDDAAAVRQEIEQLKKTLAELEKRLEAQEKQQQQQQQAAAPAKELQEKVEELDSRVSKAEVKNALDRLNFSGDYRFEAHTIFGHVPAYYNGMMLQNLVVRSMFAMPYIGGMPTSINQINNTVNAHYAEYLNFTSNLTFSQLKKAMATFPPAMQQQLFALLLPATYVPGYQANTADLLTNRLRLNFTGQVADNVSYTARLSMYKTFGDSTGVQLFNGQPNTFNIDGTTTGVPNSDIIRVDRAYFSWNHIGNSKFYLSIGRRPSTDGPPMNYRNDELRGGTPSGSLIDFQFDGITLGYHFNDNMVWRLCYGIGYQSGFGNGNLLLQPQDRLKDTQLIGANLGAIDLFGVNVTRKAAAFDLYGSANFSGTHSNGQTSSFGGLMCDPFDATCPNRTGYMFLGGVRYRFANDERTKVGFEYNYGSKYWFNFAQSQDDIISPKTSTRGNVYETYLTHRISERFILKASYINYDFNYSGSGWHVGAPKALGSKPILGFPTYDNAWMFTVGITARF